MVPGVQLPVGFGANGQWHRSVELRAVTGADELAIERTTAESAAVLVTRLLARCVIGLGPLGPPDMARIRTLAIGDREALVLQLRRLTFGERVSAVLSCPRCTQRMDLELRVDDLLVAPVRTERAEHELDVASGASSYRVRFRLPNGEDQELAASLIDEDLAQAVALVLRRCVSHATLDGDRLEVGELPEEVVSRIAEAMAGLDPQAELLLQFRCPSCDAMFEALFDCWSYFARELLDQRTDLLEDVHLLALHYHWSEAEILELPRERRRRYLDLLADHLGAERG